MSRLNPDAPFSFPSMLFPFAVDHLLKSPAAVLSQIRPIHQEFPLSGSRTEFAENAERLVLAKLCDPYQFPASDLQPEIFSPSFLRLRS